MKRCVKIDEFDEIDKIVIRFDKEQKIKFCKSQFFCNRFFYF